MKKPKDVQSLTTNIKPKYSLNELLEQCDPKALVPQDMCEHEWQQDGQTLTAVRVYCPKCGKKKMH